MGSKEGGVKTRETNRAKYGLDYYSQLGKLGGSVRSPLKGFGNGDIGRARAKDAGRLGGSISKRTGVKSKTDKPRIKPVDPNHDVKVRSV